MSVMLFTRTVPSFEYSLYIIPMKITEIFLNQTTENKYRNEIMQKKKGGNFPQVSRSEPRSQIGQTLRWVFSVNFARYGKLRPPGGYQGLPQQNKLKFSDLQVSAGDIYDGPISLLQAKSM